MVYTVALVVAVAQAEACCSFAGAVQTDNVVAGEFAVLTLSVWVAAAARFAVADAPVGNNRCVVVAANVPVEQFPFVVVAVAARFAVAVAPVGNYRCEVAAAYAPVGPFPFVVAAAAVHYAAADALAENYYFPAVVVLALA